ncbi:hypothetical protein SPKIRA_24710 [Sphingomonas paucimobilis]|nr:hypothetical protein SPKIRA_24710 [Sphingomonas paucimobilis]
MDRTLIRRATDQPVKGVDLADDMPLPQSADRRIAGHGAQAMTIEGQKGRVRTPARSRRSGLGSRVTTTDHYDIKHALALPEWRRSVKAIDG